MMELHEWHTDSFDELLQAERDHQDAKWDTQDHDPIKWLGILAEEFGELASQVLNWTFPPPHGDSDYIEQLADIRIEMQNELIQVAAVCKVMWECGKRNGWL